MQILKPEKIIEEISNLKTGEKYKNDEEWKAKGIPESDIRRDVRVIMPSLDLFGETKQNGTMAITRAQQAKQMLQDGGMLVKPGNGKRPGYRSAKAQEVQGRSKASTTKPGTSGGSTAKDDDVAPGYNPKTGRFERPDPSGPPGPILLPPTPLELLPP